MDISVNYSSEEDYRGPWFLFHYHLETIVPAVFRYVNFEKYRRERIETPDGDFLDLDWTEGKNSKLVILCHGLEGNSRRPYMKGMAKALHREGMDILSWNYRGCSGEINRKTRYYHSGATDDLDIVIGHVLSLDKYSHITLIGFSLGGNLILKYLGEQWESKIHINAAVSISVPLDLTGCSDELQKPHNWIYNNRFLVSLREKVMEKARLYPGSVDTTDLKKVRNLRDFDEYYTAPYHGFKNALDYYHQCSSIRFIDGIEVPTLIINARNDPFLSPGCFPTDQVGQHKYVTMRIPERGGHVGFSSGNGFGIYWSEENSRNFLKEVL